MLQKKFRTYGAYHCKTGVGYATSSVRTAATRKKVRQVPCPADFYATEIDGLKEYRHGWAWGCCPFHADSNPSFTVNLETGAFRCMSSSCGVSGPSIVSFVSQLHGLSFSEARRQLENWS